MLPKLLSGIFRNVVVCFSFLFHDEEYAYHDDYNTNPTGKGDGFVEDELGGEKSDDVADGE